MTVRDILRKAECSIQPNAGNVWLLAVSIWIKGVLKEVCVMLCWNKKEGEAEPLLWHFVLSCRTVNLAPTKSWFSSLLKRGLISLSRATPEVFFTSWTSPFLIFSNELSQASCSSLTVHSWSKCCISFGFCLGGLTEPVAKLSVLKIFVLCSWIEVD